jgi:hypothetical protein
VSQRFGPDGAESLAGVLAQCAALAHLNLCGTSIHLRDTTKGENQIGEAGAASFAGVLAQCAALTHLNLCSNGIEAVGEGRIRASWRGQASGLLL